MTVVNFPPNTPPAPMSCDECNHSKFFVYEDQSFICSGCGAQYDWGQGTNGNGKGKESVGFEADLDLLQQLRPVRGPNEKEKT